MLTGPHKELKNLSGEGLLRAENFIHSVVFIFYLFMSFTHTVCVPICRTHLTDRTH